MGVRLQGWRRILISLRAQRRSASLDRFAAVSKEADTRLAGIGLLVRGRHALYVSALAALLASRGARVWEAHDGARRACRATPTWPILESPLPADCARSRTAACP